MINLRDYSHTAGDHGWGAGWPICSGAAGDLATVTAARSAVSVTVRKRLARLVDLLLDWTESPTGGGYLLKGGQCGGYVCRAIAGTAVPSNHSWGLALDLNWQENPYSSSAAHTMPTAVARRWNRYGFAWGGDYTGGRFDWMHLEFMGTPGDADEMTVLAIAELTDDVTRDDGEDDDMSRTYYAKGDQKPDIDLVEVTMDPVTPLTRRYVGSTEWAIASQGGARVAVIPQAQFDAIPKVPGSP